MNTIHNLLYSLDQAGACRVKAGCFIKRSPLQAIAGTQLDADPLGFLHPEREGSTQMRRGWALGRVWGGIVGGAWWVCVCRGRGQTVSKTCSQLPSSH